MCGMEPMVRKGQAAVDGCPVMVHSGLVVMEVCGSLEVKAQFWIGEPVSMGVRSFGLHP